MNQTVTTAKKKLNLGCGTDIREGWVNLDFASIPGVDVVHNIEKLPLPFNNSVFEEVLCQDILEHVEYVPILKEIHRILVPGGKIKIRVPHFTSNINFIDPTHKKMFSVSTFRFFIDNKNNKRGYYFDFRWERVMDRKIIFEHSSSVYFYNSIIERLVNVSPRMQEVYESTFLSRIFPAMNIEIALIK